MLVTQKETSNSAFFESTSFLGKKEISFAKVLGGAGCTLGDREVDQIISWIGGAYGSQIARIELLGCRVTDEQTNRILEAILTSRGCPMQLCLSAEPVGPTIGEKSIATLIKLLEGKRLQALELTGNHSIELLPQLPDLLKFDPKRTWSQLLWFTHDIPPPTVTPDDVVLSPPVSSDNSDLLTFFIQVAQYIYAKMGYFDKLHDSARWLGEIARIEPNPTSAQSQINEVILYFCQALIELTDSHKLTETERKTYCLSYRYFNKLYSN